MTFQNGTAAFLKRDRKYLLIKRSPNRKIAPSLWSGIGGHIESHELNNPMSACLREIYEETGIQAKHVYSLELRYIIIRRAKNIIRQNYIYFGITDIINVLNTDEGTLHWVNEKELLEREFTKTFEAMLRHYINTPDNKGRVIVGVAENDNAQLHMKWSALEDFE